jgi:hypothetical protein
VRSASQDAFAGGNGAFMPAGQMDGISSIIDMAESISMHMSCALSAFYELLCGGNDWDLLKNKLSNTTRGSISHFGSVCCTSKSSNSLIT